MKIELRNNGENGPQSFSASSKLERSHKDFENEASIEGFGATPKEAYKSLEKAAFDLKDEVEQLISKLDKTLDSYE